MATMEKPGFTEDKDETAEPIKEKAANFGDSVAEKAKSMAEERRGDFKGKLDHLASALKQTANNLEAEGSEDFVSQYLHRFSGKIEELAHYVEGKNTQEIIDEGKIYITQRPVLTLGALFALGFVGARLLKSGAKPVMREARR